MKTKLRKEEKGFTIIEVLIVLAIAGLIILIVFLAVPALQRNSRNTQRRNDVASVGGALSEYINNNNGTIPGNCTGTGCDATFGNNTALSLYDKASTTNFTFTNQATATAPGAVTNAEQLRIYSNAKCNGTAPTAAGASRRSLIALFAVETSSGTQAQCQEL